MEFYVAEHPLVAHKLTLLRSKETSSLLFRELVKEIVTLLAYEATREIKTEVIDVETPLVATKGVAVMEEPRPIIVPILRAGLGMLDGLLQLLPMAEVGFLGMRRDETTLEPITYANRLPDDLAGRQCYVIDPMLATGGTLIDAINYLSERGVRDITAICILGAPEGVEAVKKAIRPEINLHICLAALDEKLNENGYIVPGLGDAGDRLYGVVD
jgi:uracil phosphoribosyltransferase